VKEKILNIILLIQVSWLKYLKISSFVNNLLELIKDALLYINSNIKEIGEITQNRTTSLIFYQFLLFLIYSILTMNNKSFMKKICYSQYSYKLTSCMIINNNNITYLFVKYVKTAIQNYTH
jgi:hypothetical protein